MNRPRQLAIAAASAVAFAASAFTLMPFASAETPTEMHMPATAAEHAAEADKYDREALELEAKSERYAKLARQYRARISGGSKQAGTLTIFATRYERLAQHYRQAARRAREMAQAHREMEKVG